MQLLLALLLLGGLPWVVSLVLPPWLVLSSMVLVLGVPCLFVAALTLLFVHDWHTFTPFTPSAKGPSINDVRTIFGILDTSPVRIWDRNTVKFPRNLGSFGPTHPSPQCGLHLWMVPKPARSLGHRRYRGTKDLPEDIDAVIIGSGQGGLSCGATLAQFGERCVVFEQHEVTGGGAHSFAADGKGGYLHDVCKILVYLPPSPLARIWV